MGWEIALLISVGTCILLIAHAITQYGDEEVDLSGEYSRVRQHRMMEEYYRTKKEEEERNG